MQNYTDLSQDVRATPPKQLDGEEYNAVLGKMLGYVDEDVLTILRVLQVTENLNIRGTLAYNLPVDLAIVGVSCAFAILGLVQQTLKIISDERDRDVEYNARAFLQTLINLRKKHKTISVLPGTAGTWLLHLDDASKLSIPELNAALTNAFTNFLPQFLTGGATKKQRLINTLTPIKPAGDTEQEYTAVKTQIDHDLEHTAWYHFRQLKRLKKLAYLAWWWNLFTAFERTAFYRAIYHPGRLGTLIYQLSFWVVWMTGVIFTGAPEAFGIAGVTSLVAFGPPAVFMYVYWGLALRGHLRAWINKDFGNLKDSAIYKYFLAPFLLEPVSSRRWLNNLVDLIRVPIFAPFMLLVYPALLRMHFQNWISKNYSHLQGTRSYRVLDVLLLRSSLVTAIFDLIRLPILLILAPFIAAGIYLRATPRAYQNLEAAAPQANVEAAAPQANGTYAHLFMKALSSSVHYQQTQYSHAALQQAAEGKKTRQYEPPLASSVAVEPDSRWHPYRNRPQRLQDRSKEVTYHIPLIGNITLSYAWLHIAIRTFVAIASGFVITYFTQVPVISILGDLFNIAVPATPVFFISIGFAICYGIYYGLGKRHELRQDKSMVTNAENRVLFDEIHRKATSELIGLVSQCNQLREQVVARCLALNIPVEKIPEVVAPTFEENSAFRDPLKLGHDKSTWDQVCSFFDQFFIFVAKNGSFFFWIRALLLPTMGCAGLLFPPATPAMVFLYGLIFATTYAIFAVIQSRIANRDKNDKAFCEQGRVRLDCLEDEIAERRQCLVSWKTILSLERAEDIITAFDSFAAGVVVVDGQQQQQLPVIKVVAEHAPGPLGIFAHQLQPAAEGEGLAAAIPAAGAAVPVAAPVQHAAEPADKDPLGLDDAVGIRLDDLDVLAGAGKAAAARG